MKRFICSFLSISILSMTFASCTTIKQDASTVRTMDIYGPGVLQHPVIAEMDVQIKKVEGVARSDKLTVETLKILATRDALEHAGADILVEPSYRIESTARGTIVRVAGFPATYTNFRPLEYEDIPLVEAGQLHKANVEVARDLEIEEKSGGGVVLVVFAAALVGLILAVLN